MAVHCNIDNLTTANYNVRFFAFLMKTLITYYTYNNNRVTTCYRQINFPLVFNAPFNGNNKKNYKIHYYNHNGKINNFWHTHEVYNINIMLCVNRHLQRYDK